MTKEEKREHILQRLRADDAIAEILLDLIIGILLSA